MENCRLPPINVRQDWSHTTRLTGDLTITRSPETFARQFPNIKPTGAYEQVEKYFVMKWDDHVWELRELLIRMRRSQLANNFGLQAMLAVLCQGNTQATSIQQSITILSTTPWRNGSGKHSDPRLDESDELVDAELPGVAMTAQIRNALYTCRWVLMFFCFKDDVHWVAAVFDQDRGTLTLYDTYETNRDVRAKAAGLAWRSFALNLGMPCGTRVLSVPLRPQPNGWACGYIGLVNLLLVTRCRQGDLHKDLPLNQFPRVWLHADARPESYAKIPNSGPPFFPIPDWTYGASNGKEAWRRASTVLHAMIANELGIRSLDDLRGLGNPEVRPYRFEFITPFPGDATTLYLPDARDWKTKRTHHHTLYSGKAPMLSGLTALPTKAREAPTSWAPFRDYIYRNLPGEAGTIVGLSRHIIKCWNPRSSLFLEQNLPQKTQTAQTAISVSSGTQQHSHPYDIVSVSSGEPGE